MMMTDVAHKIKADDSRRILIFNKVTSLCLSVYIFGDQWDFKVGLLVEEFLIRNSVRQLTYLLHISMRKLYQ